MPRVSADRERGRKSLTMSAEDAELDTVARLDCKPTILFFHNLVRTTLNFLDPMSIRAHFHLQRQLRPAACPPRRPADTQIQGVEASFWTVSNQVAVGTAIADRPPHRSVHAELPHTALA